MSARTAAGLTLVELMIALAVAGMLAVVAAPYFGDYIRNSRLRESGNTLYTETLMAQSDAIKRNTRIRISTAGAVVQSIDMSDPTAPVVLRSRTVADGVTMATATFDFGGEGRLVPFGTSASVNLSMAAVTCSTETRCPGLRVDGGGWVQLCGNHMLSCP